jgi:hypothetical protein
MQKLSVLPAPIGHVEFGIMTGVKGKDHGTDKMTLQGPTCNPTIKIHWGKGTANET